MPLPPDDLHPAALRHRAVFLLQPGARLHRGLLEGAPRPRPRPRPRMPAVGRNTDAAPTQTRAELLGVRINSFAARAPPRARMPAVGFVREKAEGESESARGRPFIGV